MIGWHKFDVDTPALMIDLPRMEGNLAKMADFFKDKKTHLRPHTKTHKTPILAHKQMELGAPGVTCAKLSEAEVLVAGGIPDILIANEIVGEQKLTRLARLARHARLTVAVDHVENVRNLQKAAAAAGSTIGVLVDNNIGMDRCGVDTPEQALELAREVVISPNLDFTGLMGYEGHLVTVPDKAERTRRATEAFDYLAEVKSLLEKDGIEVREISGGGTGTYDITGAHPAVTELQAGSYIFMDVKYRGVIPEFEQALTLLVTVVSRPAADRVIVDAGKKAITDDFGVPRVKGVAGATLDKLSEEHGRILLDDPGAVDLKPGDKLELIPSHGCTTINLHDQYVAVRDNQVEAIWVIAGRGKTR